jgi:hypothetical protein
MTDDIDAEAEAFAGARCESSRPMLSGHFDAPQLFGRLNERPG